MDAASAVLDQASPAGTWAREHLAGDIVGWLTPVEGDDPLVMAKLESRREPMWTTGAWLVT